MIVHTEAVMKWLLLAFVFLAGCTAVVQTSSEEPAVGLSNLGPAPELSNDVWLNTDTPLRLADLRGKVVLIDMWTYG